MKVINQVRSTLKQHPEYIVYGIITGVLIMILNLTRLWSMLGQIRHEWYASLGAICFLFLGLYMGIRWYEWQHKHNNKKLPWENAKTRELGLTKREVEVLILLAGGLSNRQIAEKLFISLSTVKTHISTIYRKMGAKRRTQALRIAVENGIIGPDTLVPNVTHPPNLIDFNP